MKKVLYLVRHSGPFIDFINYKDYKNVNWSDYNRNMILSLEGEKNASKLSTIKELKNVNKVYSSDSYRAIATARYISENIELDDRINERELGINKISELSDNFTVDSFNDKNLKMKNGESLNETDKRFNDFLSEKLKSENKLVLVVHGMLLLSYLEQHCNFKYNGKEFDIKFHNKEVLKGRINNPDVFKITYNENNKVLDIHRIIV